MLPIRMTDELRCYVDGSYHQAIGEKMDHYTTYMTLARRILMHQYLLDEHSCQMLEWDSYNQIKDSMLAMAQKYRGGLPNLQRIVTGVIFDESIAQEMFPDWALVKDTLDFIATGGSSSFLPDSMDSLYQGYFDV